LLKLIGLRARAGGRQMVRGLKTPRGTLLFLGGCALVVLWLGPAFLMAATHQRIVDPQTTRMGIPAVLLLMSLLTIVNSGGDKAVYFSPGEVNFLLGGPFTRRELLAYKLLFSVLGSACSALIFATAFLVYFQSWLAAYIGSFLALGLMQLLSMSCLLVAQSVGERAYSRSRKVLLAVLGGAFVLVIAWALNTNGRDLANLLGLIRESTAGRVLFAVFDVYGQVMTADRLYPELLVWGGLALTINCALAVFVMYLDADYVEASVIHSQKQYERLQRVRRGGLAGWSGYKAKKIRFAPCPWFGGTGPIAWRQFVSAVRSARGLLIILVILAVVVAPALVLSRSGKGMMAVLGVIGWMGVFLTQRITFDFRGDLDHMDVLKSLPLHPASIVLGELITPLLVLTLLQLLIVTVAVATGRLEAYMLVLGAVVLLPVNFILFEIENLLFLLFPSRQMTGRPTDFQFFGRVMLMLFAKVVLLLITAGLVGGTGFLVYLIVGRLGIAAIGAGAGMLVAIAVALVPCVAYAFRRFDLSTETPP
jgi:hypothetical protein